MSAAKLTKAQERGVQAMLEHKTISEAAAVAGVSERTLYAWRQQEAFREALRAAQRDAMASATRRLARACSTAVDALERVLGDIEAPPAAVVAAARTVLEHAHKALELDDLAARLDQLEQQRGDGTQPTAAEGRAQTAH